MRSLPILLLLSLASAGLLGCSDVFDQKGCTAELRSHQLEMTREITLTSAPVEHEIEGCLDASCRKSRPDPNGSLKFGEEPLLQAGAFEGQVVPAGNGTVRVTVRYFVHEGSTQPLTLRVLGKDGQPIFTDQATPTWAAEECHPPPTTTKL